MARATNVKIDEVVDGNDHNTSCLKKSTKDNKICLLPK